MRYASVCDGIGAVHVAWQPLGWECVFTSEIDPFPSAVVEQRWGFENRGDMTKFKEWSDGSPIDLLVGGTPCQSFSVAGLRKGLHDPRGGLMLTFLEIAQRHRPRWVVWENVPGVLSSNGGRDFGAFLGALGELGYGWAYRVLDAQWFGVAQRRRRVFAIGCLGDERRAAQVLFESESVRRDTPPSRAKGEGVAISPALRARANCSHRAGTQAYVPDVSPALKARDYKGPSSDGDGDGDGATLVPIAFHPTQDPISSQDGLVHALGTGSSGGCATAAVAFDTTQITSKQNYSRPKAGEPCHPLSSTAHPPAIAFANRTRDGIELPEVMKDGVTPALTNPGDGGRSDAANVACGMAVRRLTPRECERLQGFPDDYTAITYRNKPAADGPRYKALGNSMAVPVMAWIGARLAAVDT